MKISSIHDLEIGDRALRRKWGGYLRGWIWVEFEVTSSYLWLISQFPEDYRVLN